MAVRWRLERNDCQNRGYVLDGYPKNFVNAENVFVVTPPAPAKVFDEDGQVPIEKINRAVSKSTGIKAPNFTVSIKSFNEYNSEAAKDGYAEPRK